ncbi:hypothetical protein [Marinicella gelatinilytica]|uniref:hypothetical protein n=1 Tax=Marinicella gelatinilytica TaxID=2996017 RepID=UPI002260D40C|nr:hypothetical protein [Marinicella gelatinilytica]MCX7546125.1 hypothetical protein [Marinicella gelatinilytica]
MENSTNKEHYINPTAKGVYRAIISADGTAYDGLIKRLLRFEQSPKISKTGLCELFGTANFKVAYQALKAAHKDGFVSLLSEPRGIPNLPSDELLHDYVEQLFRGYGALLVNEEGFELVNTGFDDQEAAAFAAMAGALFGFQESRVKPLIEKKIIKSRIWKLCGYNGKAEVSFYPLVSDRQNYMLVTKGGVLLNQINLTDLARLLYIKY